MTLDGLHAVITGASMGLGARIAKELVLQGASVLICAREEKSLQETARSLMKLAKGGQIVASLPCDVTDESSVDALRDHALEIFPQVDALVNNAGVYGPFGAIEDIDWAHWKHALMVNLFGTVYPCRAFVPHFKANRRGRIVNISGGGATSPLPFVSAYAASKAAVVRFSEGLAGEVMGFGITVNAIAPGVLKTRMTKQLLQAGPNSVGKTLFDRVTDLAEDGETSITKAALLTAYLCSPDSEVITGRLISALWDPWPTLHHHSTDLQGSDIYTIRRIVPKDRGRVWGN